MRRLALVTGLLTAIACGSGSGDVPVDDPISGLDLPIGDGEVTSKSEYQIQVHYPNGDAQKLQTEYAEAVTAKGWTENAQIPDLHATGYTNSAWESAYMDAYPETDGVQMYLYVEPVGSDVNVMVGFGSGP